MTMRKTLGSCLIAFAGFIVALPAHAQFAAGWSIVPAGCQDCPAAWRCVIEFANNLVTFAVGIGILIVVVVIAYAGIMLLLSPANPESKSQAKKMLINAAVGLLIVLASWFIVDKILEVLGAGGVQGTTSVLGTGSNYCYDTPELTAPEGTGSDELSGGGGNDGLGGVPDGILSYQSGVEAQKGDASGPLAALLSCMATKLPADVGQISAISEKAIANGSKTMAQCAATGCAHTANSCHYGGRNCIGQSYAVDFGDEWNAASLRSAAAQCNPSAKWNFEGNHVHISVGASNGCECDQNLNSI